VEVSKQLQADFPNYRHLVLPADDIRDKPAQNREPKTGVWAAGGSLKSEHADAMRNLLEQITWTG
jgi:hypothetical protein